MLAAASTDSFFGGPWWDVLLIVFGAVLSLVLQLLSSGGDSNTAQAPPLRLRDVPDAAAAFAHAEATATVVVRHDSQKADDGNEISLWLLSALAVSCGLAAAYLEARQEIADGLRAFVAIGVGFWLVTYGVLLRRKAIVGLSWTVATAVVAVVFLLAPAVISALAHPDYVAGRSYSQLLKSYDSCGLSGVIDFDGFRGVVFVAAQLFGVLLYIVAWTAGTTLLLVLMAVNLARLKARPLRLWTRLLALPGPWRKHPLRVVSAAFACALASLAVSGGTAQRQVFAHSPQLSQVRASVEDGRVQLMVRSDFPAHVTIRLGRSGSTRRTVRRDAVQGVNRFGFKQADGSHWPEKTYRLRLTARDAKGKTAEPISMLVPGRYPDRAAWTCEKPAGAA